MFEIAFDARYKVVDVQVPESQGVDVCEGGKVAQVEVVERPGHEPPPTTGLLHLDLPHERY